MQDIDLSRISSAVDGYLTYTERAMERAQRAQAYDDAKQDNHQARLALAEMRKLQQVWSQLRGMMIESERAYDRRVKTGGTP